MLDCLNSVQHLQPSCLEDRFLPQQNKEKQASLKQGRFSPRFPTLAAHKEGSDDLHSHRRTTKKLTRLKGVHLLARRDSSKDDSSAMSLPTFPQACPGSSCATASKKRFQALCSSSSSEGLVVLILRRHPVQQTLLTHNAFTTESLSPSNCCHQSNLTHKRLQRSILTEREHIRRKVTSQSHLTQLFFVREHIPLIRGEKAVLPIRRHSFHHAKGVEYVGSAK